MCGRKNNIDAYANCATDVATDWNEIGVKYMERYVSSFVLPHSFLLLSSAKEAFESVLKEDPSCTRARVNYVLVLMAGDSPTEALMHMEKVLEEKPYEVSFWAIRAFVNYLLARRPEYDSDLKRVMELQPRLGEGRYMGILEMNDTRIFQHHTFPLVAPKSREGEAGSLLNFLLFEEFSPVSLSDYALRKKKKDKEFFVQNQYIILRRILPPFVLESLRRCYQYYTHHGIVKIDDGQSKRYFSSNDPCSRYIHYSLTDLVRQVISHNAIPTYVYFGGYVSGAVLEPHTDRMQCEFTMSLTFYQNPFHEPWNLGIGKKIKFVKSEIDLGGDEPYPPEDEQVHLSLFEGDALLFMGRHLTHWREGPLPEGHQTYNLFLHYVQENFSLVLD
eukprot:TRINITY_DN197_c0_g1_i11.p1 TRINITY_DN197_c0_g1~~TRINITY_DN197_c0_g1_i11.p1  ORF type:complete len:388 (-),score=56.86 TRINITY_DN197_c0_g1_i11:98-1261(-)